MFGIIHFLCRPKHVSIGYALQQSSIMPSMYLIRTDHGVVNWN